MKIHIDDSVLVTCGKDRGKVGTVMRVSDTHSSVVVEKVNIRTKHVKKRPGQPGQKIRFEAAIDASNVMVICPHCKKAVRVTYTKLATGKKQRVCKKCGQGLDSLKERKKAKKL